MINGLAEFTRLVMLVIQRLHNTCVPSFKASTDDVVHSHHVTVSMCRQHSYANLLEQTMPALVERLAASDVRLRRALPPHLHDITGVADVDYARGEELPTLERVFREALGEGVRRLTTDAIPAAVDAMAREFMRTALPPLLSDCK